MPHRSTRNLPITDMSDKHTELLRAKINGETSRLPWTELQRFYAGGVVVVVSDTLDLVDVAVRIAQDDKNTVAQWMNDGLIAKANDAQAQAWLEADLSLWAVVVKPWILVQCEKMQNMH